MKYRHEVISPAAEYLIEDLNEAINDTSERLFAAAPFQITARGYRHGTKDTPIGINRLRLRDPNDALAEVVTTDFQLEFPLSATGSNGLSVAVNWTNGKIHEIKIGTIPMLVEHYKNGEVRVSELDFEEAGTLLDTIGLPSEIYTDNIHELTRSLLPTTEDLSLEQSHEDIIDPATSLHATRTARIFNKIGEEPLAIQELCLNINHLDIESPSAMPAYRNELRFARQTDDAPWEYRGCYEGAVATGELLEESVHVEPSLTIPSDKLLEKALYFLRNQ